MVSLIDWTTTPKQLVENAYKLIDKSDKAYTNLLNFDIIKDKKLCYEFISILADDITCLENFISLCIFIKSIYKKCVINNFANKAYHLIINHQNKYDSRNDIYIKIKNMLDINIKYLSQVDINFLQRILFSYEKNGANLNSNLLDKANSIKKNIMELENQIVTNITEYNKYVGIDFADLDGMPLYIISKLPIIDKTVAKYGMQLNADMYNICMSTINSDKMRKRIEYFYHSRCLENSDKLLKLFYYRSEYAKIYSFNNYTDFRVTKMISNNHIKIKHFLEEMLKATSDRYKHEIEILLKLKKKLCKINKTQFDNKIHSYELEYLINKWKQKYGLDENYIRNFFPKKNTIKKILNIYETLLSIKIKKVQDSTVWHHSVEVYQIIENNIIIGTFYLDLYKRNNKVNIVKCFNIKSNSCYPYNSGIYQHPICALVCNFQEDNDYLSHKNIVTLFHELGHIMHMIFGNAKYCIFSGTSIEKDFVEVYGLFFEKLAWDYNILNYISSHKIPKNIIQKMCKIRNIDMGIRIRFKLLKSYYDQLVHCSDNFNILCTNLFKIEDEKIRRERINKSMIEIYNSLYDQIMRVDDYIIHKHNNLFSPSSWLFLVSNYHSLYYSEVWGDVYATDLFLYNLKKNAYNKIKQNMSYDPINNSLQKLTEILNRHPSNENYLHYYNFIPNSLEYSYEISSDNTSDTLKKNKLYPVNKKEDSDVEYTNKFSEYNESDIHSCVLDESSIMPIEYDYDHNHHSLFIK